MENGGWRQHKYTAWLESLVGNYIWQFDGQVKIRQYFLLTYTIHVRMAIPYRAAKFRSTNAIAIAILGPTTEFGSCQIFPAMLYYSVCMCIICTSPFTSVYLSLTQNSHNLQHESVYTNKFACVQNNNKNKPNSLLACKYLWRKILTIDNDKDSLYLWAAHTYCYIVPKEVRNFFMHFHLTFEDSDIDWGVECHEFIDHRNAGSIVLLSNAEQNFKLTEKIWGECTCIVLLSFQVGPTKHDVL